MQSLVNNFESLHPGERATLLARLLKDKIPIESGFIIASQAFDSFSERNGIKEQLDDLLKKADHSSMKEMQSVSRQIKRSILHGEFPEDIARQILQMYLSLNEPRVVLFPSFFAQDHENPLFTEIESLFFGYQGDANFFEGIKEVWSHFFDAKLLFYREKHAKDHFSIPFSICVQKQPNYKVTAVVYTDDPTSQTKQTTLIKAVFGEGALVGELEGADYYWVKRGSGEIYNTLFDTQHEKVTLSNGREQTIANPASTRERRKLSDSQLEILAKVAKSVQQHFFFPQEFYVGIDGTHCVVIDTKQFNATTQPPRTSQPAAQSATPIVEKVKEKSGSRPSVSLRVGLVHPLAQAAHLPIATQLDGHLCIDPTLFLQNYQHDLPSREKKTLSHGLHHALQFIATHTHAQQGLLYTFESLLDTPDRSSAEMEALHLLHTSNPSLPIGLVTKASSFEEYQRAISVWMGNGLPRSSRITHVILLNTPTSLYSIQSFAQVGVDTILLDLDELTKAVHGGSEQQKHAGESEALLDLVRKAMGSASELGVGVILKSTNVPSHAMLEAIQSSVPVEWLTMAKSYGQLTSK